MRGIGAGLRRLIIGLLVAGPVLSGCGGTTADAAETIRKAGVPPPAASQAQLLAWAEQAFTSRCMARSGFRFAPGDWRGIRAATPAPAVWGADDIPYAAQHGYLEPVAAPPARDPNELEQARLPPSRQAAYRLALFGAEDTTDEVVGALADGRTMSIGRDGCTSEARRALYGDLDRWWPLEVRLTNEEGEILAAVAADPRFAGAVADWSRCMRTRGSQPYATPEAARRKAVDSRGGGSGPSEWERRIAVADATCNRLTGLAGVGRNLAADHRRRIELRLRAQRSAYAGIREAALVRARDLAGTFITE
jgi:hypothetical protein